MKRIFTIAAIILFSAVSSSAQRSLSIKDLTTASDFFSGGPEEAGIVISCPGIMDLTFKSSLEDEVDIMKTEVKGEDKYYFLRFKADKKHNLTRRLTIYTDGFIPLTIDATLKPKALKRCQVFDPDADFVYGCYYEYRKRGNEFFQKSMYDEAKENYLIAKSSSDCPESSNIDELIAKVDSIAVYKERGDAAAEILDYNTAINHYTSILALNSNDMNVRNLRNTCFNTYRTEIKKAYDMAEVYSNDGEYDKALELYEKVVDADINNPYTQDATDKAKRMRINIQNRKQRAKVLLYEFSMEAPVGISYGTYKTRKVGKYFNFSFHPDAIKLAQGHYDLCKRAEVNLTPFGWDFNLVPSYPHFWLFFGIGYTGVGKFFNEDGSEYVPGTAVEGAEGEESVTPEIKLFHAASPEAGLMVKIWRVSLRYTFQYRYGINKGAQDQIGKFRHVAGLGFNF